MYPLTTKGFPNFMSVDTIVHAAFEVSYFCNAIHIKFKASTQVLRTAKAYPMYLILLLISFNQNTGLISNTK
jgi:hypothetical protein